ncbi:chymotrypsin-like protease CTRL-1 [Drosophila eugracilis]|uniref:chymotrypsin-like protease CTRL-1 n=1 Tax=Drosophila eugracilis TaxID=29029 RepID=UPI0007E6D063|nr:chymotrypsin-like protease CTRL-1 [Drosophila eugracilis]
MNIMGAGVLELLLLVVLGCLEVQSFPRLLDPQCMTARGETGRYRIINGKAADLFSNPWMVIIIERGMMRCGGSLITPRFVLTAAHCRSETKRKLTVRLGEYDVNQAFDCSRLGCIPRPKEINVTNAFVYRNFVNFHRNDIALFKLETAVQYGDYIRPICLFVGDAPRTAELLKNIRHFNSTGWGRTQQRTNSPILQQITLTHYDLSYCSSFFGRLMDNSKICVGSATSSTCNGDSGGPLTARLQFGKDKLVVLFGVVSYGAAHCHGPTIYTSVVPYADWIESVVRNH